MTTMNTNTNANANVISNVKRYDWTDKKGKIHQCLTFKLGVRLVKEARGVKVEESHGFVRLADDVKARIKALENGTKIYWSSNVYKTDEAGNFVRDDMGDRVKESAWLIDCGNVYNDVSARASLDVFEKSVNKGLSDGTYVLQPEKEKAQTKAELVEELKQANETIRILKMRVERLEAELAEAKAK